MNDYSEEGNEGQAYLLNDTWHYLHFGNKEVFFKQLFYDIFGGNLLLGGTLSEQ